MNIVSSLIFSSALVFGPYQAELVRVIDGDTFLMNLAVYPGQINRVSIREDGINTPEKRTRDKCEKEAGIAASKYAEDWLQGKQLMVGNVRPGKFARRLLGNVYADGVPLGTVMLKAGHARPYTGGKREPWCN